LAIFGGNRPHSSISINPYNLNHYLFLNIVSFSSSLRKND